MFLPVSFPRPTAESSTRTWAPDYGPADDLRRPNKALSSAAAITPCKIDALNAGRPAGINDVSRARKQAMPRPAPSNGI